MQSVDNHKLSEWIAECLLNDFPTDSIRDSLRQKNLADPEIDALLEDAQTSPYLAAGKKLAQQHKRMDWLLRVYEYTHNQSLHAGTVERRSGISAEEFLERYYSTNRPVILTDLMTDWDALEKWTPAYLKQAFGHIVVEYLQYAQVEDGYRHINQEISLAGFIDKLTSVDESNEFYMTAYNTHKHQELLNGLLKDIRFFPVLDPALAENRVFLWLGPKGTTSGLHIDPHNVFLTQVRGRKLVRLVPSFHLPYVYLDNDFFSPVNPEAVDYQQFPMFQYAPITEVILEPGEVLFIPVAWWHQVRALDMSISLSFTNFVFNNTYPPISQVFPMEKFS